MRKLCWIIMVIMVGLLVPSHIMADGSGVKIGDKLILKGGYEAVCIGFNDIGKPLYRADLSSPKYLGDLVTRIDTEWHLNGVEYVSGANSFDVHIIDEFVSVSDKELKRLSWQPKVFVSGVEKKTKNVKAKILEVDPLNPNYKNNTLEWDYGNGIVRRLRIIEGLQQEYYVIAQPLSENVKIEHNITSNSLDRREPVAWDADKANVELIVTDEYIEVEKSKLTKIKYPLTIDPDVAFTTSASDGFASYDDAVYANARTAVNAEAVIPSGSLYVANLYSTGAGVYQIYRSYVYFDTSPLDGYVITAANLNLWAWYKTSYRGESVQIQSGMPSYPHDPLVLSDYDLTNYVADTNCGSKTIASIGIGSYTSVALDASGLAEINQTGWTKFCLRTTGDINNVPPVVSDYNDSVIFYGYEAGVGYRPQLEVTFTASNPAILSDPGASIVTTETARFNSQLTDDGSGAMGVEDCDVRFGYCPTATLADLGGTATGSPISLLPNGVDNNVDVTVLGTFTITLPAGHIGTATTDVCNVVGSPVALVAGANVIDTDTVIGNIKVTVTLSNFAAYANITAWDDNGGSYYHTGAVPYYDVAGLTTGTQYYYAVQARNTIGTVTSTEEQYFTTLVSVGDMSQFVAYPNVTDIGLNWVKSSGANRTMVRYRLDTYPTSETGADGSTQVYFGTASSYSHTGLNTGVTYYYSAWGETGGTYSANEINLVMTTSVGVTLGVIPSGSAPSGGWFVNPDETFLANLQPWYSVVNGVADSWGMPRANAWFLMVILVVLVVGIGSYILFRAPALSLIIMMLAIMGGIAIHLLSPYMVVLVVFLAMGAWATRPQGV